MTDHEHFFNWRTVYGVPGYYCRCGLKATEQQAERLRELEEAAQRINDPRPEPGEQGSLPL